MQPSPGDVHATTPPADNDDAGTDGRPHQIRHRRKRREAGGIAAGDPPWHPTDGARSCGRVGSDSYEDGGRWREGEESVSFSISAATVEEARR